MSDEDLTAPELESESELAFEGALRPRSLAEFVGATTRSGLLPNPLRDRFGFTAHLEFYGESELSQVLARAATMLDFEVDRAALAEIAGRCRGTPRIANRLLRRVRDYALVHGG